MATADGRARPRVPEDRDREEVERLATHTPQRVAVLTTVAVTLFVAAAPWNAGPRGPQP